MTDHIIQIITGLSIAVWPFMFWAGVWAERRDKATPRVCQCGHKQCLHWRGTEACWDRSCMCQIYIPVEVEIGATDAK